MDPQVCPGGKYTGTESQAKPCPLTGSLEVLHYLFYSRNSRARDCPVFSNEVRGLRHSWDRTPGNSFGTSYLIKGDGAQLIRERQDIATEFPPDIASAILPSGLKGRRGAGTQPRLLLPFPRTSRVVARRVEAY